MGLLSLAGWGAFVDGGSRGVSVPALLERR
jgi:hypothetical protein